MKENVKQYAEALLTVCEHKKKGEVEALIGAFVKPMIARGKIRFLRTLLVQIAKRLEDRRGVQKVACTLAHCNEKGARTLASSLTKALGRDVELEVTEDGSLLAGGIFTIGDMRYDGSLKTRIKQLEKSLY